MKKPLAVLALLALAVTARALEPNENYATYDDSEPPVAGPQFATGGGFPFPVTWGTTGGTWTEGSGVYHHNVEPPAIDRTTLEFTEGHVVETHYSDLAPYLPTLVINWNYEQH